MDKHNRWICQSSLIFTCVLDFESSRSACFFKKRGRGPYWLNILKIKKSCSEKTNQKTKKEMKKTKRLHKASSHSDIASLFLAFALRITKWARQLFDEAWKPLKMKSLHCIQIHQHIIEWWFPWRKIHPIDSWNVPRLWRGSKDQTCNWIVAQQAWAKMHSKNRCTRLSSTFGLQQT